MCACAYVYTYINACVCVSLQERGQMQIEHRRCRHVSPLLPCLERASCLHDLSSFSVAQHVSPSFHVCSISFRPPSLSSPQFYFSFLLPRPFPWFLLASIAAAARALVFAVLVVVAVMLAAVGVSGAASSSLFS